MQATYDPIELFQNTEKYIPTHTARVANKDNMQITSKIHFFLKSNDTT